MSAAEGSRTGLPDMAVLAILDEPPFCWLEPDGTAMGCDVEVATTVLRRAGVGGRRLASAFACHRRGFLQPLD